MMSMRGFCIDGFTWGNDSVGDCRLLPTGICGARTREKRPDPDGGLIFQEYSEEKVEYRALRKISSISSEKTVSLPEGRS